MNKNAEALRNMVSSYIYSKGSMTEEEIDNLIEFLSKSPLISNNNLTEDEIKMVRNQIHSEFLIKLELGTPLLSKDHVKWFLEQKSELDMNYWNRYQKYLLDDKKFPANVVNSMDKVSDEITDLLGDPNKEVTFQRRGLIIGDVQSGKTANYTGLICKAADAGYKVIVLLTGTIEKLRQQTQIRLDEGFIGRDSNGILLQKEDVYIGAGKHDKTLNPVVFTSKSEDFNTKAANRLGLSLNSLNEPVLFVIKKNVTVLKRLNQWLRVFNLDENKSQHIDKSLLMIDDEADNASINVNSEDCDPTVTNYQIREMLGLFKKSSYVGFTATPFANIFINPNSTNEMINEDLFPKDYIYSLDAPSNYIGARDIFGENGKHSNMIEIIRDGEIHFPISHKIDFIIKELSPSLKNAINQFLLANVVRDLRGDIDSHRSMIVNASRFVNMQRQFKDLIDEYVKEMKNSVRLYSSLPKNEALADENILSLYNTFQKDYSNIGFNWNNIQDNLDNSIRHIDCMVVNGKSYKNLDYDSNGDLGLRVIVVGGMGLSRGLTLEGLLVSYFYRNSKMYDTLMQMGRWFGYRKNYDDLCKIWIDETNVEWYQHISDATDELRSDIKVMHDQEKTPLDFGLRVRNDINTLLVTARNKMRTAKSVERVVTLSATVLETPKLYNDDIKNKTNLIAVDNLINSIKVAGIEIEPSGKGFGYKNIDKKNIIDFLKNYDVSYENLPFDINTISEFISNYVGKELNSWDVVFINGSSKTKVFTIEDNKKINLVERSFTPRNNGEIIQISGHRNRLGSMNDSLFGLSNDQILKIKENYNSNKAIPQREYFKISDRNPLIMIYLMDLIENNTYEKININVDGPLVGIGIGFPQLPDTNSKLIKYTLNLVALQNMDDYQYESGEENDD